VPATLPLFLSATIESDLSNEAYLSNQISAHTAVPLAKSAPHRTEDDPADILIFQESSQRRLRCSWPYPKNFAQELEGFRSDF